MTAVLSLKALNTDLLELPSVATVTWNRGDNQCAARYQLKSERKNRMHSTTHFLNRDSLEERPQNKEWLDVAREKGENRSDSCKLWKILQVQQE